MEKLVVPFLGKQITLIDNNGVAYVAMREVVEGVGLDWASQTVKLKKNTEKFGCCDIATPTNGGIQSMLCIPLKKLNGWLFSINPNKVRADLKEKLIAYQEECFLALVDYWTFGVARREEIRLRMADIDERERISKQNGCEASQGMHQRKREKHALALERQHLQQLDLFFT